MGPAFESSRRLARAGEGWLSAGERLSMDPDRRRRTQNKNAARSPKRKQAALEDRGRHTKVLKPYAPGTGRARLTAHWLRKMRRRTAPPRPKSPEPKSRRVAGPGVTPLTLAFSTVPTGAITAVTTASAFAAGAKTATTNRHAAITEIALITFTSLSARALRIIRQKLERPGWAR